MDVLLRGYSLVTLHVTYYLPDYSHLVNSFLWQTLDLRPDYPRIELFLDFWRREIDAVIKDILISDSEDFDSAKFNHIETVFRLH